MNYSGRITDCPITMYFVIFLGGVAVLPYIGYAFFWVFEKLKCLVDETKNKDIVQQKIKEARLIEKARVAEINLRTKQIEIGDPLFDMIIREWIKSGKNGDDRRVFKTSYREWAYVIEVIVVGPGYGPKVVSKVSISLREPKHSQVFICGEVSKMLGSRGGKMSIAEGRQWIASHLQQIIFPPWD